MRSLLVQPGFHREKTFSITTVLSASCLFLGIGGSLAGMFSLSVSAWTLTFGLVTLLLSLILGRFRNGGLVLGFLAVFGMAIGFFFEHFCNGLYGIIDEISYVIGAHIGRNLAHYSSSDLGINYAYGYLSALLALSCVWLVKNRCTIPLVLIAILLAALDILLGITAQITAICLMIMGILLTALPSQSSELNTPRNLYAWLCTAICILCIMGVVYFSIQKCDLPSADKLHTQLLTQIHQIRFGGEDSLPNGDFSSLSSLEQSDEIMLKVTMDNPESLYLRGFIGVNYTAEGWKKADPVSLSDGADLFYWLHQAGFYGQTQLAQVATILDNNLSEEDVLSISIEHIGASRAYVYAPYELLSISDNLLDSSGIGDIQPYSLTISGAESYHLTSLPNQIKRFTQLSSLMSASEASPDEALEQYLIDESHYNAYVYDHFLDVPDNVRTLFDNLLGDAPSNNTRLDYVSAKQRILTWLEDNVEYNEIIAPHASGTDFLEEFLSQTCSGYDVHYATAAVMMMRYYGIPARYVEGYLISPDVAKAAEPSKPISLDGSCGHAWCEIYQDGIGWIPFETTPKYQSLMESADVLLSSQNKNTSVSPADTPQPQEENSLDMQEDLYDNLDDQDETNESALPSFIFYLAGMLLMLLFSAVLILCIRRKITLSRLNRQFKLNDRKKAVVNLYAYLFTLMCEIYRWPDCVAPSAFIENVRADLGEDTALKYQQIVNICEAAAFDRRGISEEDYLFVRACTKKTVKILKKRCPFPRKLYLQYFKNTI